MASDDLGFRVFGFRDLGFRVSELTAVMKASVGQAPSEGEQRLKISILREGHYEFYLYLYIYI